jgi:hypothetical protein
VCWAAPAIVPSKKVGGPGAGTDVPVTHINASYVRSHFDAIGVGVPNAPRANEMVVALVMTTGPVCMPRRRPGRDVKGEDGLRRAHIRKLVTVIDETLSGREGFPRAAPPPSP